MEKILNRYPLTLADGLVLRPLQANDETALSDLFRRIPVDERRLLKDDVTRPEVVAGWIRNLNYGNIFPLLALDGPKVVADATLHRDRAGWSRHVAKVRLTLDPEFRGRGLARVLVRELIDLAETLDIGILHAEILPLQADAIELFTDLDFMRIAVLPSYAIDLSGRVHDVHVYSLTTLSPERFAPEASLKEDEADCGGGF